MRTQTGHADYADAQTRLFRLKAEEIDVAVPPDGPDAYGVVIDYPTAVTIATLVVIADGTVDLLLSEGPAFIGAGKHEEVARAAHELLSDAQSLHSSLNATTDFSLPSDDHACVYLLTSAGVLGGKVSDQPSKTRKQLAEICRKGDAVITTIRVHSEGQEGEAPRFSGKDNWLQAKIVASTTVLGALVGVIAAPIRLAGLFLGGLAGLIVGFFGSGLLLMLMDARRRSKK